MKTTKLILFVLLLSSATVYSQPKIVADESDHKNKMQIFNHWVGQWKGEGTTYRGPQNAAKSSVTETIEMKLDGAILVVEGIGKIKETGNGQEKTVHHAFGVLSYDMTASKYRFETYLSDGKSTEAWFNVIGENQYQWGFDSAQGKIKYTITIDPTSKTWQEIGEFSQDEKTWYKMFEMKLKKV